MFEGLLQPTHLVLILAIVLIVFGPGKLPGVGKAIGESVRELRRSAIDPVEPIAATTTTTTVTPATPTTVASVEKTTETVTTEKA